MRQLCHGSFRDRVGGILAALSAAQPTTTLRNKAAMLPTRNADGRHGIFLTRDSEPT
jgi:hypothetical protein